MNFDIWSKQMLWLCSLFMDFIHWWFSATFRHLWSNFSLTALSVVFNFSRDGIAQVPLEADTGIPLERIPAGHKTGDGDLSILPHTHTHMALEARKYEWCILANSDFFFSNFKLYTR